MQCERGATGPAVELSACVEEVVGGDELEAAGAVQPAKGVAQGHHPARVLRKRKRWKSKVLPLVPDLTLKLVQGSDAVIPGVEPVPDFSSN